MKIGWMRSTIFALLLVSPISGFFGPDSGALPDDAPPGVKYIGRGYDLIQGNPDGMKLGQSSMPTPEDPGIKLQNWFKLSYTENRKVDDYTLPDDIDYDKKENCVEGTINKMIMGEKSYQEKLQSSVEVDSSFDGGLWSMAFSVGMKSKSDESTSQKNQKVYFEEYEICTSGSAAFRNAQQNDEFELTNSMRTEICRLPQAEDITAFYKFLERYGTHIIVEAELGNKIVTRRETTYKSFTKNIINENSKSAGAGASYLGIGGSIDMKLDSSKIGHEQDKLFDSERVKWNMGTKEDPVPLKMKLTSIIDKIDVEQYFWKYECVREGSHWKDCCQQLKEKEVTKQMETAIRDYPSKYLKVSPPTVLEPFEIVWPEGHWAIPQAVSGCPHGNGFEFKQGTISQDTFDGNEWDSKIHWDKKAQLTDGNIVQRWCAKKKNEANQYELPWPAGKYCIGRVNDKCPPDAGFEEGWVLFNDNADKNYKSGEGVPDGIAKPGESTKIEYCCRSDGESEAKILLPTDHPFYLIRQDNDECQGVEGMKVSQEWVAWSRRTIWPLAWDEEDFSGGSPPYLDVQDETIRLFYCYYEPENPSELNAKPKLQFELDEDDSRW